MKRKISAKKFLHDVHSGLSDHQLIEKYRITPVTLQYIFRKLIQAGVMTHFEFYARSELRESELFAAFSEDSEGRLRCPQCGQPLPDDGGECASCETLSLRIKSSLPTEILDSPGQRSSDRPISRMEIDRKTQSQ